MGLKEPRERNSKPMGIMRCKKSKNGPQQARDNEARK